MKYLQKNLFWAYALFFEHTSVGDVDYAIVTC